MDELFSDDEHVGTNIQLTINDHYAKAFEHRKEREELEKLKAKYGSDYDTSGSDASTDSESAESEDEDGEELTPAVDAAILRTLARIKKKEPGIYDSSKNIFGEEQEKISSTKDVHNGGIVKEKSKPVTLRQAKLDSILHGSRSPSPIDEPRPFTHVEEQERLRKETIAAFHNAVPGGDGGDDFLIPRAKTKDELEQEEEEYRSFLAREVGDLSDLVTLDQPSVHVEEAADVPAQAGPLTQEKKKRKKSKSGASANAKTKPEEDQEFLMNYILNRGWIDHSDRHVPTYNEITASSSKSKRKTKTQLEEESQEDNNSDLDALSEASFDSLASHFEASYNHRFEEPDAAVIPTYPRNMASTVRRSDTVRKDARERKKQRKEEELEKKKEEVRRLKALKMREVRRKLEKIGREAGLKSKGKGKAVDEDDDDVDEALMDLDLEGEWDPEKHDLQMAGIFEREGEYFEDQGDDDGEDILRFNDDGKPVWDDDIDIGDIASLQDDSVDFDPKKDKKERKKELKKMKKKQESAGDDEGVDIDAMDADALPMDADPDDDKWDGTEEMRKRVLDKYMDEVYGLEFNDMVADIPTRFKYVPTQSTSYSLSPVEILLASDRDLNEYMSVKKYAPYRIDKADKHRYSKSNQEKLKELKGKLAERGGRFGAWAADGRNGDANGAAKQKKRKGKKERLKEKAVLGGVGAENEVSLDESGLVDDRGETLDSSHVEDKKSKKRKRDGMGEPLRETHGAVGEVDEESGKKKKRKHRKQEANGGVEVEIGS